MSFIVLAMRVCVLCKSCQTCVSIHDHECQPISMHQHSILIIPRQGTLSGTFSLPLQWKNFLTPETRFKSINSSVGLKEKTSVVLRCSGDHKFLLHWIHGHKVATLANQNLVKGKRRPKGSLNQRRDLSRLSMWIAVWESELLPNVFIVTGQRTTLSHVSTASPLTMFRTRAS